MNEKDYTFVKKWKNKNHRIIKQMYPDISDEWINQFLDNEIDKNINNYECLLDNDYINRTGKTNLLNITEWIYHDDGPICAGNGTFFKPHGTVHNILASVIKKLIKSRKAYKNRLHDFKEGTYEYKTFDRKQITEKVVTNSIYGGCGMAQSFLYNKYTAPSITSTGQSLISTVEQMTEAFFANNVNFNNLNECMTFMDNVVNEDYKLDNSFINDVDINDVKNKIKSTFREYKNSYDFIIDNYLNSLNQSQLNRLYYKNNVYEFSNHDFIKQLLCDAVDSMDEFKNPNVIPENAEPYLKKLLEYYREFVFYNHSPMDRIERLKNDKRRSVVTIDTDSTITCFQPWYEFMLDNISPISENAKRLDETTLRFMYLNIIAYIASNIIADTLAKYTKDSNIPKDERPTIRMKNEFLFSRMILGSKKKRYITSIRLREGDEIYPEKIDIKGMDFMKSTATEEIKERFIDIIKRRIIEPKEIDVVGLLQDTNNLRDHVNDSLHKGERTFLLPKSVNEVEAYKNPFSEQGVRAVILWNYLYPDQEIVLPTKMDLVKLTLNDDRSLNHLRLTNKEMYDRVEKYILNNPNDKISSKGLDILAIPRNIDKIPEWLIPYIDYNTIVIDTISPFYSVLESIGLHTLTTSKKDYHSNILNM